MLAQQIVEKRGFKNHTWDRTLRLGAFGLFMAGPALSNWYRVLDKYVTIKNPIGALTTRVALDQLAFSPVSCFAFFTVNGFLEGKDWEGVKDKLSKGYWQALLMNWKVWTGIQFANFYFVPVNHRTLVVNTVALAWNTYMSNLNMKVSQKDYGNTEVKSKELIA